MATVPVPATFATGERVTALKLNTNVRDVANFLLDPPRCTLYMTADQSIPNTTATNVTGYTELVDTDAMYSGLSRITIVTTGTYRITAGIRYVSNSTGYRGMLIRLNGTSDILNEYHAAASGQVTSLTASRDFRLTAGDYIELQARQSSGAALNISGAADENTFFAARWVCK